MCLSWLSLECASRRTAHRRAEAERDFLYEAVPYEMRFIQYWLLLQHLCAKKLKPVDAYLRGLVKGCRSGC